MWWGYSPALDIQSDVNKKEDDCLGKCLEVLIVGAGDARHIVKTLASSYMHPDCTIVYHVIEPTLEQVARSILLLSTCLDKNLGLQEATRYYLEILGNTLVRPATAKYLAKCSNQLANIPSKTIDCPWLNLDNFKYKEKDQLEGIFKFWERATCENVPIMKYWDERIRKSLKTRYDYREGVFDWDYHMILKSRGAPNLTIQEYRFWRNNGIAFTWLEGEPARSNPTLLSNIIQHGPGFLHYAYLGDITNGPFFTWVLNEMKNDKKYRASDVAEREVMRSIHEIKTKEPFCEKLFAAHRDPSIVDGVIVTEMPNDKMEQDSWSKEEIRQAKGDICWVDVENHKVIFHPITSLKCEKFKTRYNNKFDAIWVVHNMTKQISSLVPLLKKGAHVLVELNKYSVELRKENLQSLTQELKNNARENNLYEINDIDYEKHCIARFCKM